MKECLLLTMSGNLQLFRTIRTFDTHSDNFVFLTKKRDIEILIRKKLLKCKERAEVRITLPASLFGV